MYLRSLCCLFACLSILTDESWTHRHFSVLFVQSSTSFVHHRIGLPVFLIPSILSQVPLTSRISVHKFLARITWLKKILTQASVVLGTKRCEVGLLCSAVKGYPLVKDCDLLLPTPLPFNTLNEGSPQTIRFIFGVEKLEWMSYNLVKVA